MPLTDLNPFERKDWGKALQSVEDAGIEQNRLV